VLTRSFFVEHVRRLIYAPDSYLKRKFNNNNNNRTNADKADRLQLAASAMQQQTPGTPVDKGRKAKLHHSPTAASPTTPGKRNPCSTDRLCGSPAAKKSRGSTSLPFTDQAIDGVQDSLDEEATHGDASLA